MNRSVWVRIAALASFLSVAWLGTCPRIAHAEPLTRLIPRLIEEQGLLKPHIPGTPSGDGVHTSHPDVSMPMHWLGSSLRVGVLARDWREAYSIANGHPLVFDRMRIIRSSRMAVTRLSLAEGRFVPFVEISVGQWRLDPELMPTMPRDTELAAQVATGFQLRLAPNCAVGLDVEKTSVYRDPRDRTALPVARVTAAFAAIRAEF